MINAEVIKLEPTVLVEVDERGLLQVSHHLEMQVEEIWLEQKALRGDKLFNGVIFNAVQVTPQRIIGHWMPYRYAFAGYRNPVLGRDLGILPLAVNGITRCNGRLLAGLRSPDVVSYPNTWELAPSGGVDPGSAQGCRLDIKQGVLKELYEETGITVSDVLRAQPIAAVKDWGGHALEVVFLIDVREVVFEHFEPPIDEYRDFVWLLPDEWELFAETHRVVPMSHLLKSIVVE